MISVIIPTYNVEDYAKQCLDSLLNQTYKELQIIIIDDSSTDNTIDIVKNYEDKFKNITIISQKNQGVSVARNTAFNYINGEYTIYVDSDDFLESNMLELMYKKATSSDLDVVICEFCAYYSKSDDRNYIEKYNTNEQKIYNSNEVIDLMLNYSLQGQLWNKMFRTDLLKNIDFKFEPGRYIQDIFPVFKAIHNSNKIGFINKPLYYYRQRQTSTVHKKNSKLAEDYYFAMSSIIKYIEDEMLEIDHKSLSVFRTKVLSHFIAHYTNANRNNSLKKFKNSRYNELSIKNKDFMFLSKICYYDKLKLFLWNCGLYLFLKNLKN